MHKLKHFVTIMGMAALFGAATPSWSESAPVFDVDTFESGPEQSDQDLPMPPEMGDESVAAGQHQAVGVGSEPDDSTVAAESSPKPMMGPQSVGVVQRNEPPAPMQGSGVSVSTENMSPEQRMHRLEQQLTNLQNSQGVAQVESLQTEVQSLRGQLETLTHELDKMRTDEKARLASGGTPAAGVGVDKPEASKPAKSVVIGKKSGSKKPHVSETDELSGGAAADVKKNQPNVAEEQQIYQTAYDLIKAKKYNDAVTALQGMLKKYPTGQFASNAHYWLGELYGLMSKHENALDEFRTVISKFPDSPRVSDAELKVGLILAAQSKWSDAKKAFKKVINTYPGTAPARLASEQLKQIKLAGH